MGDSIRAPSRWARGATAALLAAALTPLGCSSSSTDAVATGGMTSGGGTLSSGGSGSGGTPASGGSGGTPGSGGVAEVGGYEVLVDPYGNCPLVAVVNVVGIEAGQVQGLEVVVAGQNGSPDFVRQYSPTDPAFVALDSSELTFSEPGYHVPVLGLYADAESSVRIRIDREAGDPVGLTLNIATHLLAAGEAPWAPTIQVETALVDQMEPGWTVAEISIEPNPAPPVVIVNWTRTVAYDERGDLRWALRLDGLPPGETFTMTRSLTGDFLTGSFDTIVEMTKLGRVTHSLEVSGFSLHHEILQIGSDDAAHASPGTTSEHLGNLLVLASKDGAATIQDHILELDPETGAVQNDWDLGTVFDTARTTFVDPETWAPGAGDWLHTNGLAYSKQDESIIVSGRHQGVAKIRRDGSLVWLLAPHEGWEEPQAQKLLTAVSAASVPYDEAVQLGNEAAGDAAAPEFDWPFGQHSPALLPNGDLLLFDNGSSRHFGPVCGSFSRAVVYRIDEAALTIRQVGQFVLSTAESSCFVSNTHWLPVQGNLFIQPGGQYFDTGSNTAVVKEASATIADDGTIAFDAVVFAATLDMNVIPEGYFAYSYRGHRWVF